LTINPTFGSPFCQQKTGMAWLHVFDPTWWLFRLVIYAKRPHCASLPHAVNAMEKAGGQPDIRRMKELFGRGIAVSLC